MVNVVVLLIKEPDYVRLFFGRIGWIGRFTTPPIYPPSDFEAKNQTPPPYFQNNPPKHPNALKIVKKLTKFKQTVKYFIY
jgi:hypothetical protein